MNVKRYTANLTKLKKTPGETAAGVAQKTRFSLAHPANANKAKEAIIPPEAEQSRNVKGKHCAVSMVHYLLTQKLNANAKMAGISPPPLKPKSNAGPNTKKEEIFRVPSREQNRSGYQIWPFSALP